MTTTILASVSQRLWRLPASVFKRVSHDLVPVRFCGGTGRNYPFQHSNSLTTWLPVPGHETIPGTNAEIEVTASQGQGFYRVAVKGDY